MGEKKDKGNMTANIRETLEKEGVTISSLMR